MRTDLLNVTVADLCREADGDASCWLWWPSDKNRRSLTFGWLDTDLSMVMLADVGEYLADDSTTKPLRCPWWCGWFGESESDLWKVMVADFLGTAADDCTMSWWWWWWWCPSERYRCSLVLGCSTTEGVNSRLRSKSKSHSTGICRHGHSSIRNAPHFTTNWFFILKTSCN